MTYRITRSHKNRTVTLKDGITSKIREFTTREDAQRFADSCFSVARCDWKNHGRRLPKYTVVRVGA